MTSSAMCVNKESVAHLLTPLGVGRQLRLELYSHLAVGGVDLGQSFAKVFRQDLQVGAKFGRSVRIVTKDFGFPS